MAKTKEGDVQQYGMKRLKDKGCLVRKFHYEGRRAAPDTINFIPTPLMLYRGFPLTRILFIEYKADENIQPEPHQLREHDRIRAAGGDVRVIGSRQQVDDLIKELFPE